MPPYSEQPLFIEERGLLVQSVARLGFQQLLVLLESKKKKKKHLALGNINKFHSFVEM